MTAGVKELTPRAKPRRSAAPLTQPASGLRGLADAFGRLGYDVEDLLAAASLTRRDLEDPDALLPCSALPDMVNRAQKTRPMKNLPLRLATESPMGAFPLLDYLVLSSETVGEGYRQLIRYLGLVGSTITFEIVEEADRARVEASDPGSVFGIEYTLSISVLHFRRETGNRLRVESLEFAHRLDDVAEFEQLLGCAVHAEAGRNGITLPRASWRLPLQRRDPILRDILERQAKELSKRAGGKDDFLSRVKRLLAGRVAGRDTRISTVAREMATSPRTLQRQLAALGSSYQKVLDRTRREAAEGYLEGSSLSAGEIAYLLGFSEPAAFHRAFRRWHRMTPAEFRKTRAGGASRPRAPRRLRRPRA